jgi:hypothetical protein
MNRNDFLTDVSRVLSEREAIYGPPKQNFTEIANRWTESTGMTFSPEMVVICMIDVKLARLAYEPTHADSIRDIAGYAALLAEIQA